MSAELLKTGGSEELFQSVNWFSGNFPNKLKTALHNSSRVIASALLRDLLDEYTEFLYVDVVPDEKKNAAFYQKHGFEIMEEGIPLQRKCCSWK